MLECMKATTYSLLEISKTILQNQKCRNGTIKNEGSELQNMKGNSYTRHTRILITANPTINQTRQENSSFNLL